MYLHDKEQYMPEGVVQCSSTGKVCTEPCLRNSELQINKHKHGYLFADLNDTKFVVSVRDTSRIT